MKYLFHHLVSDGLKNNNTITSCSHEVRFALPELELVTVLEEAAGGDMRQQL